MSDVPLIPKTGWKAFPSQDLPSLFNYGHVYHYALKCDCHRKPGRSHGSGSADSFHILAVLYIRSVMLKGSILRFQELFVFEIGKAAVNCQKNVCC